MSALLLLLGAAASVGVAVQDTRGISAKQAQVVLEGVVSALDKRTGEAIPDVGECEGDCVPAVRKRTGARDVVLLRILGVPTRVRVLVEHVAPDGTRTQRTFDVSRNSTGWSVAWQRLAEELFSPAPVVAPKSMAKPDPPLVAKAPPPAEPGVAPWVVAGVGVVAVAVGVGFGLSSRGARSTAANEPTTAMRRDALESRAQTHGWVANVSFGTAAVAAIAAAVLAVY